jgi:hypothetical protein
MCEYRKSPISLFGVLMSYCFNTVVTGIQYITEQLFKM